MISLRIDTKGLDSKCVGSVSQLSTGKWIISVRLDYVEHNTSYTFLKLRKSFDTERDALIYFAQTYPKGTLVPFNQLSVA